VHLLLIRGRVTFSLEVDGKEMMALLNERGSGYEFVIEQSGIASPNPDAVFEK